jgi:two-component system, LytTR family, sensor histidine kinase AlgZ
MHPILATRRRLIFYLLAWIPILALLCGVAWTSGSAGTWMDAAAVLAPASALYAFACLSPWYIARVQPLRLSNLTGLITTYTGAALAGGLLLAGSVRLAAMELDKPAPQWLLLFGMGALLYLVSVGAHYAALAVEASHEAERRAADARTLAREAELQALRMQLNPHFLFNCLHSISALATLDGVRAREMCIRLAEFLRSSMRIGDRESIPLREELALVRSYLDVEQVQFGGRLRVESEIDSECDGCAVPALLLQPLVENAVKHGIAGLVEGGSIRLAARRSETGVSITLENAFDPDTPPRRNLGMGLAHVRRRLQVRYGAEAAFDAGAVGALYRVVLRFPCESPIATSSRA